MVKIKILKTWSFPIEYGDDHHHDGEDHDDKHQEYCGINEVFISHVSLSVSKKKLSYCDR